MMKKFLAAVLTVSISAAASAAAHGRRPTDDRAAIRALLATYADAVSRKDEARFETLLLSKDIPFAYVPAAPTGSDPSSWRDYDGFRRGVFEGAPFTQRFREVRIRQHGALADVDLVYLNEDRQGVHPGWKAMQLVKVDGRWKIASEFFTDLPAHAR